MKLLSTKDPLTLGQCYEIISKSKLTDRAKDAVVDITNHMYYFFNKKVIFLTTKDELKWTKDYCRWEFDDCDKVMIFRIPNKIGSCNIKYKDGVVLAADLNGENEGGFLEEYSTHTVRDQLERLFEIKSIDFV
jgi:hypothetical protein